MNIQTVVWSRDAKINKPLSYAALLKSLPKNISKNKFMTFDSPVLDCACWKKLTGRLVGGNWGYEQMEWQAVHTEWL